MIVCIFLGIEIKDSRFTVSYNRAVGAKFSFKADSSIFKGPVRIG